MSFLFDASSIYEAVARGKLRVLSDNYTVEIARYEIGNILWKRRMLVGDITFDECFRIANLTKRALKLLNIISIECHEAEILKTAEKLKTTFYDSSYIFFAQNKNIPLVTEDDALKRKVEGYIRTMSLESL